MRCIPRPCQLWNVLPGTPPRRDGVLERRFDEDESPPYASSIEDDYEGIAHLVPGLVDRALLSDEVDCIVNKPLNDDQRDDVARDLKLDARVYHPGARYDEEVKQGRGCVESWMAFVSCPTRGFFVQRGLAIKRRARHERVNIIA
ncbi:hypothetical protein B0J13DRAFT_4861 [Dactylonectria estremocensis]|uniref:Uncharacterized protein n=1 Tax=Dactylonectria estremocensis TaxID=1079267 RepID=A0A9P9FJU7_9HYPO|nr:hypothetical protein B0J13DRAFT_4861 [Dactylonectria estremocensis]